MVVWGLSAVQVLCAVKLHRAGSALGWVTIRIIFLRNPVTGPQDHLLNCRRDNQERYKFISADKSPGPGGAWLFWDYILFLSFSRYYNYLSIVHINPFRQRTDLSASLWFSVRILGRSAFAGGGVEFFFHWAPKPSLGGPEIRHFVHKFPNFGTRVLVRTSEWCKTRSLARISHLNTMPPSACSCVPSSPKGLCVISHMHATRLTVYVLVGL